MIPRACRLGPAIRILRYVDPPGWPNAIAAIADPQEREWADAWLREQAQLLRMRRQDARNKAHPRDGREDRDRRIKASRERRRT